MIFKNVFQIFIHFTTFFYSSSICQYQIIKRSYNSIVISKSFLSVNLQVYNILNDEYILIKLEKKYYHIRIIIFL